MYPSLAVLYWVFSGLTKIGFIDYVSKTLESSLKDSVAIAKNCTPQIANIKTFFECIQHPENFNFMDPRIREDDKTWAISLLWTQNPVKINVKRHSERSERVQLIILMSFP